MNGESFVCTPWPFEYFQYEFPHCWLVVEHDPFNRDACCGHYIEFVNSETMEYHKVLLPHRQHMAICHELLTITSWREFFDYIRDLECPRDAILTQRDTPKSDPTLLDDLTLPF